ncbi:mks1p [Saccharomyces arboricola H-6]|uniref:Mks1p n=1 Tax=Saccharomyces arboricola (strain H-6 / AS 2.3317 / CBS 10644) TaxID=1160507 RepID=J8Q2U4_SACAR|nr:mks1p [Saccharomyces arboricola H-6]
MSRETFDVPNTGTNKFLKVTPNLFTPERLNQFDDVELYLTLIKASKCVEQGERLHNISWRILNKAVLKEHNINRSKKRDGVKNIYYVLNPNNKQQIKPKAAAVKQPSIPKASVPPTTAKQNVLTRPMTSPAISQGTHERSLDNTTTTNSDVKNGVISNRQFSKSTASGLFSSFTDKYQKMKSVNHTPKKEEPQTIITGFDTSSVITKKSLASGRSRSPFHHVRDMSMNFIDNETSKSTSPSLDNVVSGKSSLPQKESLFGRPRSYKNDQNGQLSLSKTSSRKGNNKIFFSSEDEDSDWDSVSNDSEFYADDDDEEYDDFNEEEADQYYRRQWDKLLFAKHQQNLDSTKSSVSSANTINSNTSHDPVRKSLLSGLFLSEANSSGSNNHHTTHIEPTSKNTSPTPQLSHCNVASQPQQNHPSANGMKQQKPSLKTSNVTALASLSPPQGTCGGRLPVDIQQDHNTTGGSNHLYESNAPLTAQTILPTALSTHMFLPNNIHQQRMAIATGTNMRHRYNRRESMDIPSKNRNTGFLKTRMEISEEEKMVRTISRLDNTSATNSNGNGKDDAADQRTETLGPITSNAARI